MLFLHLAGVQAETIYVDDFGDTGDPGQLRAAIIYATLHQNVEIVLRPTEVHHEIVLGSALPIIFQSVTIRSEGMATTINGNHQHRAFFVDAPDATVQLQNLTIANGHAQGGNGGAGGQGGGGGLGAGGAIFVNSGHVQVSNVSFSSNSAQGGKGGNEILVGNDPETGRYFRTGGGGGGLGGNGGEASGVGGGGGGGFAGDGGSGKGSNHFFQPGDNLGGGGGGGGLYGKGGAGQLLAGGGGGGSLENGGDGSFIDPTGLGGAGGANHGGAGGQGAAGSGADASGIGGGGGGGAGSYDNGGAGGAGAKYGGGGGAAGASVNSTAKGGNGGEFGGGGGTGSDRRFAVRDFAGAGGFGGGGGGGNWIGGAGGFGGGAGGGEVLDNLQGYGAGAAGTGGPNPAGGFPAAVGGGGAALGGAIFVREETGGSLTVVDSSILNSSVTGGLPGDYANPSDGTPGHAGTGQGSAMFLHGGTTTFLVSALSQTIDGSIGDAETGGYAAGNLTKTGAGHLILLGENTYHGTTTVSGGKLQLGNGGDTGSILGPLVNNAIFEVNRSLQWTYDNVMSGNGTLVKSGPSTFILTANNSANGGQFLVNEGALRISDGGKAGSSGTSIIGNAAGKTGVMELRGAGSEWTDHGSVHVGDAGAGEFTISDGAHFSGSKLLIGSAAGSTGIVTVTGANSALTITDPEIIVGASGTGTLLINNGGSIQRGLNVGRDAGSSGTVIVDGVGSALNGSVLLGDHGTGRLVIKNGASFTGAIGMGYQQGTGILDIGDYETPTTSGNISISQIAVNTGSGIVRFNQTDSVTMSQGIFLGAALYQRGSGTTNLTGTNNTYTGGTFITNGVLSVTNAGSLGQGSLSIDGGTLRNAEAITWSRPFSIGNAGATMETLSDFIVAQPITGGGGLTKTGNAMLKLSGNPGYAGPTTVQAGTLWLSYWNMSSPVSLAAGANLILDDSNMSSQASLAESSHAVLNDSSISSSTVSLAAGANLILNDSSISSSTMSLAAGANLILNDSNFNGTLSGAGVLRVANNVTLTGTASHTGGIFVDSGHLFIGDGTVDGVITSDIHLDGGPLEFRNVGSEPANVTGAISGRGALIKNGAGIVNLSGFNRNFHGEVFLREGTLGIRTIGIDNKSTLGDGQLTISGGFLRAIDDNTNVVVSNSTYFTGDFTLGRRIMISGGDVRVFSNVTITSANPEFYSGEASSGISGILGPGKLTFNTGLNPSTSIALAGENTSFTGGVVLQAGRLVAADRHSLGTGSVLVSGGTLVADLAGVPNAITLAGGAYERLLIGSLAHAVDATSDLDGVDTTAMILAGTTSLATLTTSFSADNPETLSDIYSLHGTGANLFVLQLSFDSIAPGSYLGWQDGGEWLNAREGNTNNNPLFVDPFSGSFAAFQSAHGADLSAYIGAWGTDVTGGITSTWAVLNHNSDFAVLAVPEPGTITLLIAAFLVAGTLWLRRNRQLT